MAITPGGIVFLVLLLTFFLFAGLTRCFNLTVPQLLLPLTFLYDKTLGDRIRRREEAAALAEVERGDADTARRVLWFQRENWMREEFGEKRAEARAREVHRWKGGSEAGKGGAASACAKGESGLSGSGATPATAASLPTLPPELRLQIYAHLNYGHLLTLQRVCRFLRDDLPYLAIEPQQRATYTFHAESFAANARADMLACYGCMAVRDPTEFLVGMRTHEYARFGAREGGRRCAGCELGAVGYRSGGGGGGAGGGLGSLKRKGRGLLGGM